MTSISWKLESYLKITSIAARSIKGILRTRFVKFLLVGLLNTSIGLGTMFILKIGFEWPYFAATFTGNTIGAAASFILNRSFTFQSQVPIRSGLPRFCAVILGSYAAAYSLSAFTAGLLYPSHWLLGFISADSLAMLAGTVVYTIINYFGQKRFVFGN